MYLGLDLGTSELKALLLAGDHRIVGVARAPLTVERPEPLWSEQAPSQWWQALEQVMAELRGAHAEALSAVRAIGLSGQMHGATLLDAAGEVLRPAILWNDGRSGPQCEALARAVPRLGEIAGNLAMPGFTAPKLLWVREHEPEIFNRTARVLLPKDWLRFMLSGEAVSEMSDAAGTLWLDVGARDWSDELLAAAGLTRGHMPRLVEGSEVSAQLKPELAARWGVGNGAAAVLIAGGAGDNAASAVGMGLVEPGQGFVSLGTSGVVFVSTDRFLPNPAQAMHAFCHALPGRWHQMSVMLSAASAVSWAAKAFRFADEAALLEAAASVAPAQRALPAVPAIPFGRAFPAQQSQRAGRAVRAHACARPGGDRLCRGRGRELRPARRLRHPAPAGRHAAARSGAGGRWRAQCLVGPAAGRYLRAAAHAVRGQRDGWGAGRGPPCLAG